MKLMGTRHCRLAALAAFACALFAARPGYPRVSVLDYGAKADGVADDTAALQRALDDAEGKCIVFPPGIYVTSGYLNLKVSNSCVLGERINGRGPVISNRHPDTSGYQNDGLRVGDASARDAGGGTEINIENVYVSGLNFDSEGRIGVWVVYARNVVVENITGAGQAVVAAGNDNDDECENITIRNIARTGPTPSDWYTAGIFSTRGFLVDGVWSTYSVGSQALAVTNSRDGLVQYVTIDQQDTGHDGIALLDAQNVRVAQFSVRNARKGVVIYSDFLKHRDERQSNHIGPGVVADSRAAIHIYSRFNQVEALATRGNSVSLMLGADSRGNSFAANHFLEAVLEDPARRAAEQHWHGATSVPGAGAGVQAGKHTMAITPERDGDAEPESLAKPAADRSDWVCLSQGLRLYAGPCRTGSTPATVE